MTIIRVARCDFCHKTAECPPPEAGSAVPPDYLPMGWIKLRDRRQCSSCGSIQEFGRAFHFCSDLCADQFMRLPEQAGGGVFAGRYVHSQRDGAIHLQGQILGGSESIGYSVMWLSWLTNEPANIEIVHWADMREWLFYTDEQSWRRAGKAKGW